MTVFKKITAAAAASTLALGLGMAANAAVVLDTTGDIGNDGVLDGNDAFEFINDPIGISANSIGDLDPSTNSGTVTVGENVARVFLDFNTDQSSPNAGRNGRGIQNFSVSVSGDMGSSFTLDGITTADGDLVVQDVVQFDVMGGETLTFVFSGTAFANGPLVPSYSVGVFGDEVFDAIPLPGAAVFFLTAAGAGAMRLRKKAA